MGRFWLISEESDWVRPPERTLIYNALRLILAGLYIYEGKRKRKSPPNYPMPFLGNIMVTNQETKIELFSSLENLA